MTKSNAALASAPPRWVQRVSNSSRADIQRLDACVVSCQSVIWSTANDPCDTTVALIIGTAVIIRHLIVFTEDFSIHYEG